MTRNNNIPNGTIAMEFYCNDEEEYKHSQMEMPSECYETVCWGCGQRLVLPSLVPVFKCGWCGAISSCDGRAKKPGGGVWAVFPVICPNLGFLFCFHSVVTAFLGFNTLFNYCRAAFVPAGPPPQVAWGSMDCVSEGSLASHRFCTLCDKPKPPRAHHCRACRACVLEMDHHCPFIGNCVGAANHRPFILFLLFAVFSNMYVLGMSTWAIFKIWRTLGHFPEQMSVGVASSKQVVAVVATYLQELLRNSVSSSVRALGLLYLVAVSLSVIVGLGHLLYLQVWQLYDGQTFIETLQLEGGVVKGMPPRRGWKNLQEVFRHGHPIFWILPKLVSSTNRKAHDK